MQPSAPETVLDHVPARADIVVAMANGEPVALLDVLEAEHRRLDGVDHVATEWGIAHLRGRSLADRARALIAVAHPDHREALEREARALRPLSS